MSNSFSPGTRAHVIQAYQAVYRDPLVIRAGDPLTLGQRDSQWPFIWCTNDVGKSGWVPESYLERNGALGFSRYDYSAAELDAEVGDGLIVEKFAGGWYWAVNESGCRGWIPQEHLEFVPH